MSQATYERVLREILSLPPEALAKLCELLDTLNENKQWHEAASLRDFTADRQWLADHRDEYAGQWVALKVGRLISHGPNAKEVHQAAQNTGHIDALLMWVEPSDARPFIF
jgi:hypothetical protein